MGTLFIVQVHAQVNVDSPDYPDPIASFIAATLSNAEASRKEPGVVRFDLIQDRDDPAHFVLVEIYLDSHAAAAHKNTPHYATWRDAVAPLMAKPRQSTKFVNVSPDDQGWQGR